MSLSLFHIPSDLYSLLPALAAGALAVVGYLAAERLVTSLGSRSSTTRLEAFAGTAATPTTATVPLGSTTHKVRLAFARYNIDANGREGFLLWMARLVVGVGLTLLLLVAGLPFLTSLIGLVGGYVLVDGLVRGNWNKLRSDVEAEIPGLLSGLKSAIATAPNVPQALADTARTLRIGGPLRAWAEQTASRMHAEGQPCLEALRQEAAGISSSLAVCVELIGRMWTTGGEGYGQAFENAADNLRDILSARVLARARGAGAQSTTALLMGLAFLVIVFINRNPALSSSVHSPLVQAAYAVIFLMLVYGYTMINNMIENAV
jgi:hypothetical protein